jgi:hypothetical protein
MFIYRLVTPLDDFDDLVALPDWLRNASPASIAWVLQAVLELPPVFRTPGVRWPAVSRKDVVYACPTPC